MSAHTWQLKNKGLMLQTVLFPLLILGAPVCISLFWRSVKSVIFVWLVNFTNTRWSLCFIQDLEKSKQDRSQTNLMWFWHASSLICGNKMPTGCNIWFFIADLIGCSTCFRHHYAHHQELKSIIQLHAIPTTWKPKHQTPQAATTCIILSSSWWWA